MAGGIKAGQLAGDIKIGGGVGDADTLFVDNADSSKASDFTFDGVAISAVDPINGTDAFVITHDALLPKSMQKQFNIPPKFRGKNLTLVVDANSNATAGNVIVTVHDVTNAMDLLLNEQINLVGSLTQSRKTALTFDCPGSCTQMYYKIEGLAEPSAITRVDDITLKLTERAPFARENNTITQTIIHDTHVTTLLDGSGEVRLDLTKLKFTGSPIIQPEDDVVGARTKFVALKDCRVDFSWSCWDAGSGIPYIYKNDQIIMRGTQSFTATAQVGVSASFDMKKGDYITFETSTGVSYYVSQNNIVNVVCHAEAQELERITNVKDEENIFSARIDGDSLTPDVNRLLSQSANFVDSVVATGTGQYTVNFKAGFFKEIPAITSIPVILKDDIRIITQTKNHVVFQATNAAGSVAWTSFDFAAHRQGNDVRTLADKVIGLTDFADVNKVVTQSIEHLTSGLLNAGVINSKIQFNLANLSDSGEGIVSYSNTIDLEKTVFTAEQDCVVNISISATSVAGGTHFLFYKNGAPISDGVQSYTTNALFHNSIEVKLKAGDQFWPQLGSGDINNLFPTYLSIVAQAEEAKRYYSIKDAENEFSARITNVGTAAIASVSANFIQSVTRISAGYVRIDFVPGFLSEAPVIVATNSHPVGGTNVDKTITVREITTLGFYVLTEDTNLATPVDSDFDFLLSRQGPDRRDLTNYVVESAGFPRINRTLKQEFLASVLPPAMTSSVGDLRWGHPNLIKSGDSILIYDDSNGTFTATKKCSVDVGASLRSTNINGNFGIWKNNVRYTTTDKQGAATYANLAGSFLLEQGDFISVNATLGLAPTAPQDLTIVAEAQELERVDNVESAENVFSARISNNGIATVVSENASFIQSVTRNSPGYVTIKFVPGFFMEVPTASVTPGSNDWTVNFDFRDVNTIDVRSYRTNGILTDVAFDIILQRQGLDYKNLADVVVALPESKVKWQEKALNLGTNITGILSDLTFNNLELGKTYRYTVQWSQTDATYKRLYIRNGLTIIGAMEQQGVQEGLLGNSGVFIATDTSLFFEMTFNGGLGVRGDGTRRETYAILEELPLHEQTSQW